MVMAMTRRRVAAGKPLFNRAKPALEPFLMLVAMPVVVTMTLAGIWHGAGWTFLVFGVWHGVLLAVNHGWRAARRRFGWSNGFGKPGRVAAIVLTFICVVIGLVFFKAGTLEQAFAVLRGMAGLGGEFEYVSERFGPSWAEMTDWQIAWVRLASIHGALMIAAFLIVYLLPNTPQYIEQIAGTVKQQVADVAKVARWPLIRHAWDSAMTARPSFVQGSAVGVLFALALLRAASSAPTEFLYFTF